MAQKKAKKALGKKKMKKTKGGLQEGPLAGVASSARIVRPPGMISPIDLTKPILPGGGR